MDIIQQYVHDYNEQLNRDIEKTVIDYLETHGYTVYEPLVNCVKDIQQILKAEGKMLRVEAFTAFDYECGISKMVCIPFIDYLDRLTPRYEVFRICGLGDKGYRL